MTFSSSFALAGFCWEYFFDNQNGLIINSRAPIEIYGKADHYVILSDVAVGYPGNSFGEGYFFTYKIGDEEEKTFSLESQLMDANYYFNHQCDETGFMQFNKGMPPSIEGNILNLPCVRQDAGTGKEENILLKIDFVKGTIIEKTVI